MKCMVHIHVILHLACYMYMKGTVHFTSENVCVCPLLLDVEYVAAQYTV